MYFESKWSHKKDEKEKRLGDWIKANKHTVRLMVFVLNISFSPYEVEYEQRMGFPKSSREVSQHIFYKSYSSHKQN